MKLKWGALVVAGSGKIGGHVAAKNSAGAYLRTKVTPVNPRTTSQIEARSRLGSNAKAWGGITQAQRDAWNASSVDFNSKNVFGDSIKLSGINVFTRINNNLLLIGEGIISAPPVAQSFAGPTRVTLSSIVAGGILTISPDFDVPVGSKGVVRMTSPQSAGKKFVKSEFRVIDIAPEGSAAPYDVAAAYVAKFGALPLTGQKVFVEVYVISINSGIASQRTTGSTITVAA
jgi:hypothetical protein